MSKEIIATQNRVEELLLELISDRVLASMPLSLDNPEVLAEDKRDTEEGFAPTPEQLAHRKGFHAGWWECLQALSNAINEHNEGNEFRLGKWER